MVEVQGGKVKKFLVKQFLPLGFVVVVAWALIWPEPGAFLYEMKVGSWKIITTINMAIIFFIFGITLETTELKDALKGWKSLIQGLIVILVVTSFTGFIPMHMNFQPPEFGIGLAIFACVPTSLSSGVTLVIQGYGNGALGLLLTVSSNLIGIFVSPIFVKMVLGSIPNADVDVMQLLIKLTVSILVPLLVAKGLREAFKPAIEFARKYKLPLYMFNNLQIILIVWQTLSHSRHILLEQKAYDVLFAIMAAIAQHFMFLVMNILITWVIKKPETERKALIIMCSQKSLPTAAVIISYLDADAVGDLGLISIPCIVFYIMQLFIDSFLANSWSGKYEAAQALYEKYAPELAELARQEPDWASLATAEANKEAAESAAGVNRIEVAGEGRGQDMEKVGLLNGGNGGGGSSSLH